LIAVNGSLAKLAVERRNHLGLTVPCTCEPVGSRREPPNLLGLSLIQDVHVSSTFYLLAGSRVPAFSADVQLGICFLPDWLANDDGVTPTSANCWDPALYGTDAYFKPSDDFTLAPYQSASMTILTTIEPGQTFDIEHTFSVTAERGGTIQLLGVLYAHSNQNARPWGNSWCVAECGLVTWE